MRWLLSHRADEAARRIADRHYNRQSVGAKQFVPPGRCLVLLSECGRALWVTSYPFAEYTKHAWAGAWVNSCFRNEGAGLSSELIREAVAVTRWHAVNAENWDEPPLGLITFVDASEVKSINPGCCYRYAGFENAGETQGGLLAFQMLPASMPAAAPPLPRPAPLFDEAA